MRRDLYHYFNEQIETVFNAYAKVLSEPPFGKAPATTPYSMITFGIGYSFKYNMNGAAVHIHFARKGNGTAVQVRYTIVQLFGARYQAYDNLLTSKVELALGARSQAMSPLSDSYFETEQSSNLYSPSKPENRFCGKCGAPINPGDAYCRSCGSKIE